MKSYTFLLITLITLITSAGCADQTSVSVETDKGSAVLTDDLIKCLLPDGSEIEVYSQTTCEQLVVENKLLINRLALEKERAKKTTKVSEALKKRREKDYREITDKQKFCDAIHLSSPREWCRKCIQSFDWEKLECMMYLN